MNHLLRSIVSSAGSVCKKDARFIEFGTSDVSIFDRTSTRLLLVLGYARPRRYYQHTSSMYS